VLGKTGSSCLWLGFLFLLLLSASTAKPSGFSTIPVSVSVYNDAGAPTGVLLQAENIAARIFEQAGLNVKWINCPFVAPGLPDAAICRKAIFPAYFQQRIVSPHPGLSESSFGVSYLSSEGVGCYSYVFYQRLAEQLRVSEQNAAVLLGHVMAHEIAHLLLGTNSHSASGIMRAHWYAQELASANKGELLFTPDQARAMKERLRESTLVTENTSPLGTKKIQNFVKSRK
jgi:hypothetical protein